MTSPESSISGRISGARRGRRAAIMIVVGLREAARRSIDEARERVGVRRRQDGGAVVRFVGPDLEAMSGGSRLRLRRVVSVGLARTDRARAASRVRDRGSAAGFRARDAPCGEEHEADYEFASLMHALSYVPSLAKFSAKRKKDRRSGGALRLERVSIDRTRGSV